MSEDKTEISFSELINKINDLPLQSLIDLYNDENLGTEIEVGEDGFMYQTAVTEEAS